MRPRPSWVVLRTVFTASPRCRATWKRSKHIRAFGSHFAAASMYGRHMSIATTSTARAITPSTSSHVRPRRRATAAGLASLSQSITTASRSAVKREPGSAHGVAACETPCSAHSTRGTSAVRKSGTGRCRGAASGAGVRRSPRRPCRTSGSSPRHGAPRRPRTCRRRRRGPRRRRARVRRCPGSWRGARGRPCRQGTGGMGCDHGFQGGVAHTEA